MARYHACMTEEHSSMSALRRGTIEFCVLALLAEGKMYSVELVRRLGEALGMTTSEGTMYPLLSRLRRNERIASEWRESSAGPPRRYYYLTPSGERALATFRAEWTIFRRGVDRLLGTEQS
jgi:PadR family transcriptional regulator PadR